MRRREFIKVIAGSAAWPLAARAQELKPVLVGILWAGSAASNAANFEAFRDAMRQLGYIEGRVGRAGFH
jgi:putative ABC transport system substrate-binding protein